MGTAAALIIWPRSLELICDRPTIRSSWFILNNILFVTRHVYNYSIQDLTVSKRLYYKSSPAKEFLNELKVNLVTRCQTKPTLVRIL